MSTKLNDNVFKKYQEDNNTQVFKAKEEGLSFKVKTQVSYLKKLVATREVVDALFNVERSEEGNNVVRYTTELTEQALVESIKMMNIGILYIEDQEVIDFLGGKNLVQVADFLNNIGYFEFLFKHVKDFPRTLAMVDKSIESFKDFVKESEISTLSYKVGELANVVTELSKSEIKKREGEVSEMEAILKLMKNTPEELEEDVAKMKKQLKK